MKITKTRLKKLINEELRTVQSNTANANNRQLAEQIFEETGVDTLSAQSVISYLDTIGVLQEATVEVRSDKLLEDLDMAISSAGAPVDVRAKKKGKPHLEPPGLNDPHDSGYNSNPDASINNIQIASRVLEDLPLEELPESVANAAHLLRKALDELYGANPDVIPGVPGKQEPPHFRPDR
tara:strand:- start:904 stop:1443 length:540 start_codon:yes stop_codon:yes gene_type:complete